MHCLNDLDFIVLAAAWYSFVIGQDVAQDERPLQYFESLKSNVKTDKIKVV